MRQLFQPIAAFVYCKRQAAAGRRSRCKAEISTREQAPTQMNGLLTPPMGGVQLKLFYFIS